mgnify:CR=1 FL=1
MKAMQMPQKILYDVRKFMGADDIVISDVGAHKMWIAREYNCYEPNTCIISNGFATMGIAVPGAVAAKLIYPEKKVLAISGDGGFMMNSQEYETALREGTPIVTLIFSDASYGLIKWKQMDHFGHNCFVDFQNPDFVMPKATAWRRRKTCCRSWRMPFSRRSPASSTVLWTTAKIPSSRSTCMISLRSRVLTRELRKHSRA